MTTGQAVAQRVIKLLNERNITQYKFEKKSYIPHGIMNNILAGRNKSITLTTLFLA